MKMQTKFMAILFLLSCLFALTTLSAHADGEVWFSGSHSFGASVYTTGSSNFYFGGSDGQPAVFIGSAFTSTGLSIISGRVGLQSNAFVPDGTKGTAATGGYISYQFGASHFGGSPNHSSSMSVNTWSSTTGTGNASSNVIFQGNSQFIPFTPPVPALPVPVVGTKG